MTFLRGLTVLDEFALVPNELLLVKPGNDAEGFCRFLKLTRVDEVTRRLRHPDHKNRADDIPDVANQ